MQFSDQRSRESVSVWFGERLLLASRFESEKALPKIVRIFGTRFAYTANQTWATPRKAFKFSALANGSRGC
jgi:hypothetical protein